MWTHLKTATVAAIVGAVAATATAALAGSGIGAVFNLGQANTVNHASALLGTTAGDQLDVVNQSPASNATAGTFVGKSPSAAAMRAFNTGGGPALSLSVAAGHPPFTTSSGTRVANLNADRLDGVDSSSFVQTYPGYPGNGAGTAKALLSSNAVADGAEAGLITVPGLARITAACSSGNAYVNVFTSITGDLFWDYTHGGQGSSHPGGLSETGFLVAVSGTGRLILHWFVGTPGSQNGQTLLSMTIFANATSSSCLFTVTGLVQSNAP